MKLRFFPNFEDAGRVVASWGEARLIKYLDGKMELVGGCAGDRTQAKEWISMFCHEAMVGTGFGASKRPVRM